MPRLFTLQSAIVLAILGTGAGVYVGRSAADSINPFYQSPLPSQSFAMLSPYRSSVSSVAAAPVTEEESRYALGSGCVGCRTYPQEYRPEADAAAVADYRPASLDTYAEEAETTDAPAVHVTDPDRARVERYASYPVTNGERELREIERNVADQAARDVAERADAEALRVAEDSAVQRGTEQLIY